MKFSHRHPSRLVPLLGLYDKAKEFVINSGYDGEAIWQKRVKESTFTESDLLRESAWVILCSGFRESVVRKKFDYVSMCFCDWESAETIVDNKSRCLETASKGFHNIRKLAAISDVAELIVDVGFGTFKEGVLQDPLTQLKRLPYIGDVTVFHLAKNLGFPFAKPDRHLSRLAVYYASDDVQSLCAEISKYTGDSIPYIDLVLWRYSASYPKECIRQEHDALHYNPYKPHHPIFPISPMGGWGLGMERL